jgi:hypothetical protein
VQVAPTGQSVTSLQPGVHCFVNGSQEYPGPHPAEDSVQSLGSAVQLPLLQTCPWLHTRPQPPQFDGSAR